LQINKRLVCAVIQLGDLHCGSTTGLMPPKFKTVDGRAIGQNRSQGYIWECYTDFVAKVKAYGKHANVFTLLMGDLVEGMHHNTVEVISHEPEEHERAAVAVLEEIVGASNTVEAIAGTPTHVGQQSKSERAVLKELRGMGYKVSQHAPPPMVWPVASFDVGGVLVRAAHHGRTSMLERNAANWLNSKLREHARLCADLSEDCPDWLLFGHTHLKTEAVYTPKFGDRRTMRGLISGCWQLPTGYGHKGFPFVPTDIGANIIEVYDDGTSQHKEHYYPTFKEERQYTVIPVRAGAANGTRIHKRDAANGIQLGSGASDNRGVGKRPGKDIRAAGAERSNTGKTRRTFKRKG
jgi:hypothetical protein